jgi:hypothetical protein
MELIKPLLKGILYVVLGMIVLILSFLFILPMFTGHKAKFEINPINGEYVFEHTFPEDRNYNYISVTIEGEISEDTDILMGYTGGVNVIKLSKSTDIDTVYRNDYYANEVKLTFKFNKKCRGNLKGTVWVK